MGVMLNLNEKFSISFLRVWEASFFIPCIRVFIVAILKAEEVVCLDTFGRILNKLTK